MGLVLGSSLSGSSQAWGNPVTPQDQIQGTVSSKISFWGAVAPDFDDSHVRVYYHPWHLWRNSFNELVGSMENGKLVLTYDFFEDSPSDPEQRKYFKCPLPPPPDWDCASLIEDLDPRHRKYIKCPLPLADYPDCDLMQNAVIGALTSWADASNHVVLRHKSVKDDGNVNIYIAWTSAFVGGPPPLLSPVAKVVDNSKDANQEQPPGPATPVQGFASVFYPYLKKEFSTLLFNADNCWYLDDESVCPAPIVLPDGKILSMNQSISTIALHESGHVFGFGHFTRPSIMEGPGTREHSLTYYDRTAVRLLYDKVMKSIGQAFPRSLVVD